MARFRERIENMNALPKKAIVERDVIELDEISKLTVVQGIQYGHIVRLKDGDSFVFGREYEKIQHAQLFGIPTSVFSGISSSIAMPGLTGIPITHRGILNSFTVIVATLSDGGLNPEIKNLPQLKGTFIIQIGLSKLAEIAAIFAVTGRIGEAFGIASNGSPSNQKALVGNTETMTYLEECERVKAQAGIVIGEVLRISDCHRNGAHIYIHYLN